MCNAMTRKKQPVSNSARGVTFQSYTYDPVTLGDVMCMLTDTVGLNEGDKGTVPSKDAFKSLYSLLHKSKTGYSLLIHVMKMPRITKAEHDNYQFFVRTIAESKIPCILVVTGCENVEPMGQWAIENSPAFEREQLQYKKIVSGCFAEGGRFETLFEPLREESRRALEQAILECAAPHPIKIYDSPKDMFSTLKRIWNAFCQWAGLGHLVMVVNKALHHLLIRLGFPEDEAGKLAEELDK